MQDYKEIATTAVTVANGDTLHVQGIANMAFKSDDVFVNRYLHVQAVY